MGCNCSKDTISLSLKKELRRKAKEKLSEIKRIWNETASTNSGSISTGRKELNFK